MCASLWWQCRTASHHQAFSRMGVRTSIITSHMPFLKILLSKGIFIPLSHRCGHIKIPGVCNWRLSRYRNSTNDCCPACRWHVPMFYNCQINIRSSKLRVWTSRPWAPTSPHQSDSSAHIFYPMPHRRPRSWANRTTCRLFELYDLTLCKGSCSSRLRICSLSWFTLPSWSLTLPANYISWSRSPISQQYRPGSSPCSSTNLLSCLVRNSAAYAISVSCHILPKFR